ncbi:MAG: hypothetical protein J6S60_09220 [Oscillospiraceae bacterium]|nr:hypothetical protein [Oscillospiraceae bacterium]
MAEARDLRALLAERRAQLERLEAELAGMTEAQRARHERQLHTARWSVAALTERLQKEGTKDT